MHHVVSTCTLDKGQNPLSRQTLLNSTLSPIQTGVEKTGVVLTNTFNPELNMVSNPIRQIATTTYKEGKYIRVKKAYMTFQVFNLVFYPGKALYEREKHGPAAVIDTNTQDPVRDDTNISMVYHLVLSKIAILLKLSPFGPSGQNAKNGAVIVWINNARAMGPALKLFGMYSGKASCPSVAVF
jgi:hypothetical protein